MICLNTQQQILEYQNCSFILKYLLSSKSRDIHAEPNLVLTGSCCAQILWLKQQLRDYGLDLGCIPLRCDNTSAINITKNPVMHSRTKHIDIRHHFLRDHVLQGDVEVTFVDTHNQLADIFTKPLAREQFYKIRRELGILDEKDT